MEGFFVLLALAAFAALLLGPIAFFLVLGARRRVAAMEGQRDQALLRLLGVETALSQTRVPAAGADVESGRLVTSQVPAKAAAQAPSVSNSVFDDPMIMAASIPLAPEAAPSAFPSLIQTILANSASAASENFAATDNGRISVGAIPFDGTSASDVPQVTAQDTDASVPFTPAPPLSSANLRPTGGFEEALGTRWAVWVGGAALAFGALLLVRYSIEQGLFGPAARIAMGAVLAASLIAAGEFLRRQDAPGVARNPQGAHIPGALTASGTIAAFGTIYAAHALYDFIGPAAALILLGAIGIAAMLAAALHGPALAGLGLAGAFATPLLVQTQMPTAWPVVVYLAVVASAAYGLAHWRSWLWLALTAAAGGSLWAFALISGYELPSQPEFFLSTITHIILHTGLAGYFLALGPQRGIPDDSAPRHRLPETVLAGFGVLSIYAIQRGAESGHFGPLWIGAAIALVLLPLAISYLGATVASSSCVAGVIALATILLWPMARDSGEARTGFFQHYPPLDPGSFQIFAVCICAIVAAAAVLRLWRGASLRLHAAASYSLAASVTPLAGLVLAYFALTPTRQNISATVAALALAALFTGLAWAFSWLHKAIQGSAAKLALGIFANAALAGVSLALIFATETGTLTVALALTALGAAAISVWLDIPALRHCVTALGLLICARFAAEPRIIGADINGAPLILNWLLYGYGLPAAGFGLAGWLLRQRGEDTASRVADALAVLFAALLFFFEIRHALNSGDVQTEYSSLTEQSLFTLTSLAFSIVLVRLDAARANIIFRFASLGAGAASLALAAGALLLRYNPLICKEPLQGNGLFNTLWLAYLLPGILAAILAWFARPVRPLWYWGSAAVLAGVLAFLFGVLEVRVFFHGMSIDFAKGLDLSEAGIDLIVCLLLAIGSAYTSIKLAAQRPDNRLGFAAVGFLALAAAIAVPGLGLIANPLLSAKDIAGGIAINSLLLAFGVPALLCAFLAYLGRFVKPAQMRAAATIAAICLLFSYASLEVRRVFQGPEIQLYRRSFTQDEWFTYSAVWLTLGLLLLGIGVWRSSREARLGSAVLVIASVLKIFIFDMAGLEGFLRAMSFIGLGAVLIAIGLVYQRLVFNKADTKPVQL